MQTRVSVLMPTYRQARFIGRALDALRAQLHTDWELIIVDDGSPDDTEAVVKPFLVDRRVRYERLEINRGLGAALNLGLDWVHGELIAYLPSDDVWYPEHLSSLISCLDDQPDAVAAFSGIRHHYNRYSGGQIDGEPLQLVQLVHRAGDERWVEREELVTDDLERMFWRKLTARGKFVATGQVTCEWVDHPDQLHKLVREPVGGINRYRQHFSVQHPLRFHTTVGNLIDEVEQYRHYRSRETPSQTSDGLKILLVGELAYNADRILALEERGHRLYGLWMPEPYWYNTVGPLPFGRVEDLPRVGWREAIERIEPDIIYGLLNWQAVPFAHEVMSANTGVPFVWHFKEGPFICLEKGTWDQLIDLYTRSEGQIYTSPEMRDWLVTGAPQLASGSSMILDGDLPKADWFTDDRSPRLSERDGEIHTVVPGRPIGMHPWRFKELAAHGIHLHFYGDFTHGQWKQWIETVRGIAPAYLHLHPTVNQDRWVVGFSQYDAGWLHVEESHNHGEIRRANWDDLNYPARIATLAAAGLPMIQYDNRDAIVATDHLCRDLEIGVFFEDVTELRERLTDQAEMARLRANVWRERHQFTFDAHADDLVNFFRRVINRDSRRHIASPPDSSTLSRATPRWAHATTVTTSTMSIDEGTTN